MLPREKELSTNAAAYNGFFFPRSLNMFLIW